MEPLEIAAIVFGIILAGVIGVVLGIIAVAYYMLSPNGFVKDLTGNKYEPPSKKQQDNFILRMHVDALKNPEDMGKK